VSKVEKWHGVQDFAESRESRNELREDVETEKDRPARREVPQIRGQCPPDIDLEEKSRDLKIERGRSIGFPSANKKFDSCEGALSISDASVHVALMGDWAISFSIV
jgi:hypothetical protein